MWANIVAIFNVVKVASEAIKLIGNLYDKYKDSQIDKHYESKLKRRERLLMQIDAERKKEHPSDEVLKELTRKLYLIDHTVRM